MKAHFQPARILAFAYAALALALAGAFAAIPAAAQDPAPWPAAVPPEELALKDNVMEPGSQAMLLEYEVQSDNTKSTETVYKRIKIFRDEGKKFADVEILYFAKYTRVEDIRARVTSPSGKAEEFNGTVYDKEVVKWKKFRYNAKTLALPNVEVGSVIEYSYRLHWHSDIPDVFKHPGMYLIKEAYAYPAAEWEIQQEIPVRHGRFTLHPLKEGHTATFSHDLPKDTVKATLPDGTVVLQVNYIPAFQKEEYSLPEENLKIRADVFYVLGTWSAADYWTDLARREAEAYDKFIGTPKNLQKEAQQLFSSGDADETKLRKIYARVQQIRALAFEPEKSEKERKQTSLRENKNVEDVLHRNYAFTNEINLAFIGLARAAGFQAFPVRLSSRNRAIFVDERLDPSQLNAMVVEVLLGSESLFLDPATKYCPYGLLPWEESDARGIRVAGSLYARVETTSPPESKDAVVRREAVFHLDAQGNLSGKLSVTYIGQEALTRRLRAADEDEAERRKDLEEQVHSLLPQGGAANLVSAQGWTDANVPLKAEFEIQVSNYATVVGQRLMVPVGILHLSAQRLFASPRRTYNLAFDYPWESYEDVTLSIPEGMQIEALPAGSKVDAKKGLYESVVEKNGNTLHFRRTLKMMFNNLPKEVYPQLRLFYDQIRGGDEQQVVVKAASADKNSSAKLETKKD